MSPLKNQRELKSCNLFLPATDLPMNTPCTNETFDLAMIRTQDHPKEDTHRQCGVCEKKFRGRAELTDHLKADHLGMRFVCNYVECERRYKSQRSRSNHMRSHRPGPGHFQCESCEFYCDDTTTLSAHNRSHVRNLIVWCRYCGAGFNTAAEVDHHEDGRCPRHPRRLLECFDPSDPEVQHLQRDQCDSTCTSCVKVEPSNGLVEEHK